MDGSDSHGGCSSIPKMCWAVSAGGQQCVQGPVAEQELDHQLGEQGWEMCESICHAAVLSCFSKEQTMPNAVFYVCCSLVSCVPAGMRWGECVLGGAEKGKPESEGGWEEV